MVISFVFFIESPHRTGCAVRRTIKEKPPMKWAIFNKQYLLSIRGNLVVYA